MKHIAVLISCHNRCAKTVACLEALHQAVAEIPGALVQTFLTDDGCTDDTVAAVTALDRSITVVPGTGDLYWNRGMVAAWQAAARDATRFDAFLLLNDDTVIDPDALESLVKISASTDGRAIVVGAVRSASTGVLTYGGIHRLSRWHPGRTRRAGLSERVQDVDTFNANCVLVPRNVYETIGMLDPTFTHAMGDFDYGYRARAAGIRVVVAPGSVGTCERNRVRGSWRDVDQPLWARLRALEGPKGLPRQQWVAFLRRHRAPLPGLLAYMPRCGVVLSWVRRRITAPCI